MEANGTLTQRTKNGWLPAIALGFWVSALAIFLLWPLTAGMDRQLSDDGDALQALWMIGWSQHQALTDPLELFDANLYYPHPDGLAYSEHFLPQGILAGLFMRLGTNLVLAYNLLALLAIVLIALSVRYWAKSIGLDELAAQVAAVVAAVSTFNLEEIARLHVLWMFWIPLGLAFLHRFFETERRRYAWALGAVFFVQGLSSHYYLISFPFFLAPLLAVYLYLYPDRRRLAVLTRLGLPMAIACALFVPIEIPYIRLFSQYRFHQALPGGVDLARFILAPADNQLYGSWSKPWIQKTVSASNHFLGYLSLGLAVVGAKRLFSNNSTSGTSGTSGTRGAQLPARRILRWLSVIGALFLLLACGSDLQMFGRELLPGPYRFFYDYVPFFRFARIPERFTVYTSFVLSLLVGVAASALIQKIASARGLQEGAARRWSLALFSCLMVTLPLEHWRVGRAPTRIPVEEEIPRVYRWLANQPGDFAVVELPVYPRQRLRFFGYESYFSTFHWKRIPFARPSFYPPALEFLLANFQDFPSEEATRILQSLNVKYVVVHPDRLRDRHRFFQLLERDPVYRPIPLPAHDRERSERVRELGYGDARVFAVLPESMPVLTRAEQQEIPRDHWIVETSSESDARLAIDGLQETGWSSEAQQEKGQFFDVDLGGEYLVSQISLGFVYPFSEFPRELWINGYHPSHRWERLQLQPDGWGKARVIQKLLADPATASLDFPLLEPKPLTRVRLFIPRTNLDEELPVWRIPEIRIYEAEP